MFSRFVDLSMPVSASVVTDPEPLRPKIDYVDHKLGATQLARHFPGLCPEDLPDGEGWAVEDIQLTAHSGTHMDAPWHYHSTTNGGQQRAPTIDEAPLELFLRPGVKLDFRGFSDGYVAKAVDIQRELDRIGYEIKPLDIVLVNTAAGSAYGSPDFIDKGCGIGREATLFLCDRGVKVVGTDAWSWDAPFSHTAKAFEASGDAALIWEGHKAGRERLYYQMEKLSNLDVLPAFGFTIACFPVKIERGSAGWVRAVALFDR